MKALVLHSPISLAALALCLICSFHQTALAAAGDLDTSFDGDGKNTTDFFNRTDIAQAVAVQPDGRIVVAGTIGGVGGSPNDVSDFGVARYNPDGTLDLSFGSGGKVNTDFNSRQDQAFAVAIQPDGKIIVAGIAGTDGANGDFALARYNPNGTLDTTFDGDGKVTTTLSLADDFAYAMALQADGKIVLAGRGVFDFGQRQTDFALARYNPDGSLDGSFDGDGIVFTDFFNNSEFGYALAIQPDGKLVAAGPVGTTTSTDFGVARYNSDGSLDVTFGTLGKATVDFTQVDEARGVVVQPDGRIVIGGYLVAAAGGGITVDFGLARLNVNGTLDGTFGTGGKVITDFFGRNDLLLGLALQANGKLVAAGSVANAANTDLDFALARYNTDGSLDAGFGNGGKVTTPILNSTDTARAVAIQRDGKIIAAGATNAGNGAFGVEDFALARYLGDAGTSGGTLVISEFRLRGPGTALGANAQTDEFVELYNNNDVPFTVNAADGSTGYALVASDGVARFIIPNGTVIPARGHYLGINSTGYSLGAYPAGNGTGATGDSVYTLDVPDNAGLALFSTANPLNFALTTRLDAAGSTAETNTLYREGPGYAPVNTSVAEHSFTHDLRTGTPRDTDDNATDLALVSADGNTLGAGGRLGAPGPENLTSPVQRNAQIKASLIDPQCGGFGAPTSACARVREGAPVVNGAQGTLTIRRTFTNKTGRNVTRLRFRVVDITTLNSPGYMPGGSQADLRALTSADITATRADGSSVEVRGTTLEDFTSPDQAAGGGGYNSSLSVGSITLGAPLVPNAAVSVQFRLGVQQSGSFRFLVNVEAIIATTPAANEIRPSKYKSSDSGSERGSPLRRRSKTGALR